MNTSAPIVLVADDDRDTRELYRAFFDTSGYRTAEAGTGSQALASAVELLPDVLLTDYVLPDLDGLTIARHLKADARTAAIRIVMVTGYATPALDRLASEAGVDRVLLKPALPQTVMREVSRTLARPAYQKPHRAVPLGTPTAHRTPDRRESEAHGTALTRVRDEFAALPGLSLTAEQARLVFDLDREALDGILQALVAEGFLARTSHGSFWKPK